MNPDFISLFVNTFRNKIKTVTWILFRQKNVILSQGKWTLCSHYSLLTWVYYWKLSTSSIQNNYHTLSDTFSLAVNSASKFNVKSKLQLWISCHQNVWTQLGLEIFIAFIKTKKCKSPDLNNFQCEHSVSVQNHNIHWIFFLICNFSVWFSSSFRCC